MSKRVDDHPEYYTDGTLGAAYKDGYYDGWGAAMDFYGIEEEA